MTDHQPEKAKATTYDPSECGNCGRCGYCDKPERERPDLLSIAAENVVALSAECARLRAQIEAVERLRDSLRGAKVGIDFVVGRLDAILAGPSTRPGGGSDE